MSIKDAVARLVELYGSQARVAEQLKTTQQTVSRWVKGEIPPAAEMTRLVFELLQEAEVTKQPTDDEATDAA